MPYGVVPLFGRRFPPPLLRQCTQRGEETPPMTTDTLGVVMNGVTGRMGHRQHLVRSVLAINQEGGAPLTNGRRVRLRPVLVGRSEAKLRDLAARYEVAD